MSHQLILELNDQSWENCFKIIQKVRIYDAMLGFKILPKKEIH